eukprot:TRINITY_DN1238_c1_g1_i2.p1 TRINITY_DN1238_c1_g1~~TRINITY_DN1238_c1_g1_i2.p1  ORF type:complete len:1757 (-),score=449.84 TRINITY_DN1238_c1_g1_i2:265-5535(-)
MQDENTSTENDKEELIRNLKTRGKVINELLNTEKDYVEDMKLLLKVFKTPLEESGIISKNEAWTLFGNVMDLLNVNEQMLMKFTLRKAETMRAGGDLDTMKVGDILSEMAVPLMKYELYCANQSDAFEFLEDAKAGNEEFNQFVEECMNNPLCRGLGIQAWLIKPLQRLCKYPLLIRELIKNTPPQALDYEHLKEADTKIGTTVSLINSAKDKAEREANEEKRFLTHMSNTFQKENIDLVKVGRKLEKTGIFQEYTNKKKTKKRTVTLYLFTDLLMVTGIEKGKQNLYFHCLLKNLRVNDVHSDSTFEVFNIESDETSVLCADSVTDRREWVKNIKEKIKQYQLQKFNKEKSGLRKRGITTQNLNVKASGSQSSTANASVSVSDVVSTTVNVSHSASPISPRVVSPLSSSHSKFVTSSESHHPDDLHSVSSDEIEKYIDLNLDISLFEPSLNERERLSKLGSKPRLIRELINMEKDYVLDMTTLLEVCVEPLDYSGAISRNDVWKLFSNIQDLININQTFFLTKIEARSNEVRSLQNMKLGDILFNLGEQLVGYESYCANLASALSLLRVLQIQTRENRPFRDFLDIVSTDPKMRGLPLADFLKKPMYQIYRYPLFLQELRQHTTDDHPDHSLLKDAEQRFKLTIDMIESKIASSQTIVEQQMNDITEIASKIKEWPSNLKPIIINKPGRIVVKKGTLVNHTNSSVTNETVNPSTSTPKTENNQQEKDPSKEGKEGESNDEGNSNSNVNNDDTVKKTTEPDKNEVKNTADHDVSTSNDDTSKNVEDGDTDRSDVKNTDDSISSENDKEVKTDKEQSIPDESTSDIESSPNQPEKNEGDGIGDGVSNKQDTSTYSDSSPPTNTDNSDHQQPGKDNNDVDNASKANEVQDNTLYMVLCNDLIIVYRNGVVIDYIHLELMKKISIDGKIISIVVQSQSQALRYTVTFDYENNDEAKSWMEVLQKYYEIIQKQHFKRGQRVQSTWKGKRGSHSWKLIGNEINKTTPISTVSTITEDPSEKPTGNELRSTSPPTTRERRETNWSAGKVRRPTQFGHGGGLSNSSLVHTSNTAQPTASFTATATAAPTSPEVKSNIPHSSSMPILTRATFGARAISIVQPKSPILSSKVHHHDLSSSSTSSSPSSPASLPVLYKSNSVNEISEPSSPPENTDKLLSQSQPTQPSKALSNDSERMKISSANSVKGSPKLPPKLNNLTTNEFCSGIEWSDHDLSKRSEAIKRLIENEKKFYKITKLLKELYLVPLEHSGVVSQEDLILLFGRVKKLNESHSKLIKLWETKVNSVPADVQLGKLSIGDTCKIHLEELKEYQNFVGNCSESAATYERLSSQNASESKNLFSRFIEETSKHPKLKGELFIESLLQPSLWPSKYLKKLDSLLNHTPKSHPDHKTISSVKVDLQTLIDTAEESKLKHEALLETQRNELLALDNSLDEPLGLPLSGRKILLQEAAHDISSSKSKDVKLYLLSDMLLVTEPKKAKLKLAKRLHLKHLLVNESSGPQQISITDQSNNSIHKFSFEVPRTRTVWWVKINDLVTGFRFPPAVPVVVQFQEEKEKEKEKSDKDNKGDKDRSGGGGGDAPISPRKHAKSTVVKMKESPYKQSAHSDMVWKQNSDKTKFKKVKSKSDKPAISGLLEEFEQVENQNNSNPHSSNSNSSNSNNNNSNSNSNTNATSSSPPNSSTSHNPSPSTENKQESTNTANGNVATNDDEELPVLPDENILIGQGNAAVDNRKRRRSTKKKKDNLVK